MSEVWPFEPERLSVELSWFTSVVSTFTTEQRARLRQLYPRARFQITSNLQEDDTFLARRIAERAKGNYTVPDWRFASRVRGTFDADNLTISVDDTYFYPGVDDQALAWKSPTEFYLFTISARGTDTVTSGFTPPVPIENFWIMPAHPAHVRGVVRFNHRTNNYNEVTINLETRTYKDLTSFAPSFPSFQSHEVYKDRDIFVGQHGTDINKVISYVDGKTGKVTLEEVYDHVDLNTTLSAHDKGAEKMISREGWLHKRGGKQIPFWKPSWGSDIILIENASAGATTLKGEINAPSSDYIGRRFCIDQKNSFQCFEVTSAITDEAGYGAGYGTNYGAYFAGTTVTLTITPALTDDVNLEDILTVSELNLTRLDADKIDFQYSPGIVATLNVPLAGLDNDL